MLPPVEEAAPAPLAPEARPLLRVVETVVAAKAGARPMPAPGVAAAVASGEQVGAGRRAAAHAVPQAGARAGAAAVRAQVRKGPGTGPVAAKGVAAPRVGRRPPRPFRAGQRDARPLLPQGVAATVPPGALPRPRATPRSEGVGGPHGRVGEPAHRAAPRQTAAVNVATGQVVRAVEPVREPRPPAVAPRTPAPTIAKHPQVAT